MAHFFLIGPGFIGGTLLKQILEPSSKKSLGIETVSVLTRKDEQAATLEKLGVRPVRGTLDSHDAIADEVFKSDIVVHAATADHLPSAQAVLAGLRKRAAEGKTTAYLHTSGAAVLDDKANGNKAADKVYSDEDPDSINALPEDNPHRDIDLVISRAAEELRPQGQKIAIIMPPNIYGAGTGPFNTKSIQVPLLITAALKAGAVLGVGQGKNVWSTVHVEDLADGYILILKHLIDNKTPSPSPWNPYFFSGQPGGDFTWSDLYTTISTVLASKSLLKGPQVRFGAEEEFRTTLGYPEEAREGLFAAFGSNSVSRAKRLEKLGWKPRAKNGDGERPDLFGSIATDVDKVVAEQKASEK